MAYDHNCGSKKLTTLVIGESDFKGAFRVGSSVVLSKSISDQIRAAGHVAILVNGQGEAYNAQLTRPRGSKGEYYTLIGKPVETTSNYLVA